MTVVGLNSNAFAKSAANGLNFTLAIRRATAQFSSTHLRWLSRSCTAASIASGSRAFCHSCSFMEISPSEPEASATILARIVADASCSDVVTFCVIIPADSEGLGQIMPKKVILIADPGIDTSFAIALALHDPSLDVIGLLPCAGNISADVATSNIHILIDRLDPVKWPRTAAAISVEYDLDGTELHGPDGLGGNNFLCAQRHQHLPADKVLVELVREHPRQVTVICLGPVTTFARALDRDPEIAGLIEKLVMVGGTWKVPGNAGPMAEFHFYLDPESASRVIHANITPMIVPLDVTRRLVLSPTELFELPNPESKTCQFLRKIVPFGLRASMNNYGVEGFQLKDVLGVAAVALPGCITFETHPADVEASGALTRGMLVVDTRKQRGEWPNVQIGVEAAIGEIRQYVMRILKAAP